MTDIIPDKHGLAPTPWKVNESVGGKFFMYDANNKVIVVPNMSSTGRSAQELKQIYTTIVFAVNKLVEQTRRRIPRLGSLRQGDQKVKYDFQNLNLAPMPNPKPLAVERVTVRIVTEEGKEGASGPAFIRNSSLHPQAVIWERW